MARKKNQAIRGFFRHLAQITARGAGNIASIIPSIGQSQYKYLADGVAVGFISAFIEEILKIRPEKLDKIQQPEYEKFLKGIEEALDKQDSDLAELLVARSVHYDSLKSIQSDIQQICNLLKDPEHAEISEIIEQAGNNVIPKIEEIIQTQTEELKSHTTTEHQNQLNEIHQILKDEFTNYFQKNNSVLNTNRIRILFLAANPDESSRLDLDEEIREIEIRLEAAKYRDSFELIPKWAVRPSDLQHYFLRYNPDIVHFSGHGNKKSEIILKNEDKKSKPLSKKALIGLFKILKDNVKTVVLNACYTEEQAEGINEVIDCTIGMSRAISDKAAILFSSSFYQGIAFGRSVKEAFELGINRIELEGLDEETTPILLSRKGIDPRKVWIVCGEDIKGEDINSKKLKTTVIDRDKNIIAGANINNGIDSEKALNAIIETSNKLGRTEEENKQLKKVIKQLEQKLSLSSLETNFGLEKSTPVPSEEAKALAKLISADDGLYAQALKAIAENNPEKADELLDEIQEYIDSIQQKKDEAQDKIYIARMKNAVYAGRIQEALQYQEKLHSLTGNDANTINELAEVFYYNAKYIEAEPLMVRALEIDEKAFGKEHPNVARDLNNLAQLYQDTNRLKETEPLMVRALEIDEKAFGKEHPDVARDLNNLAQLYKDTNRLKEAEPLMVRALEIDEKAFGKEHPNVAIDLNNLAQLYQDTNRLKEAEPLMVRALEIDEKAFGKEHPDVARDLNNLAQLYKDTNRLKEAEPLMVRALEIDEKAFGKEHPNVAIRLNNLALLYQDTNRLKEAEPLMVRALEIDEKAFGKEHPNVARDLNNLATLLQDTNRLKEAEPLMVRALEIDEKAFGKEHPDVARDLNNLAQLYQATNRLKEAELLMVRALEIDEKSFGKEHPNVARDLNNLAMLYQATNRLIEAEPLIERHLEIFIQFTRQTGHPHPYLEAAINNFAGLLLQMGYSEEQVKERLKKLSPEMFG